MLNESEENPNLSGLLTSKPFYKKDIFKHQSNLQQINMKNGPSSAGIPTCDLSDVSLLPSPLDQGSRPLLSSFFVGNIVNINYLQNWRKNTRFVGRRIIEQIGCRIDRLNKAKNDPIVTIISAGQLSKNDSILSSCNR